MRPWMRPVALMLTAFLWMCMPCMGASEKPFLFGMLLVGPYNDKGWSQAHYEGGRYVEQHVPGTKMIYLDNVNPSGRPGFTVPRLVEEMVSQGASLIIATSDDMKDGTLEAAKKFPNVTFIHVSGDDVLKKKAPPNLGNLMGRIEYPEMLAGFVAGLTTKTGKLGYLGPLIDDETRRIANAAYLGAAHAWTSVRKQPITELEFRVSWIGFWFNIPGVTADPTQVARRFFDRGCDIVISGLDTPEANTVAQQVRRSGREAWAMPYNYRKACDGFGEVCLGVPYFNWGPAYVSTVRSVMAGTWKSSWEWLGPDWKDINNPDTSIVGFLPGPAVAPPVLEEMEKFLHAMGDGSVNLFRGPLDYQNGTPFLPAGESATDEQIWYMKQLLKGMEGQSSTP
jgi:simple sugar transport system substrate-binding protein